MGAVGQDEWGGLFVNSMKRSGVDTTLLTVKGDKSYTGRCVCLAGSWGFGVPGFGVPGFGVPGGGVPGCGVPGVWVLRGLGSPGAGSRGLGSRGLGSRGLGSRGFGVPGGGVPGVRDSGGLGSLWMGVNEWPTDRAP